MTGWSGRRRQPWCAADWWAGAAIVHLPYTDRLFAERCEDSAAEFAALTAPPLAAGVAPVGHPARPAGGRLRPRAAAAGGLPAGGPDARGIVVNSGRELELLDSITHRARSVRMIPLPVLAQPPAAEVPPTPAAATDVVVLGFVFPDRGYEQVISALPPGIDLVCAGPAGGGARRICRTNWLGGPKPPATGCGSPDSCPIRSWPPRSTPPASRSPPTGGWRARRRSPPGSATAGGRWCRTRRTPESSPRGPPAR